MSVAAEPILDAQANARRDGMGRQPRRAQPSANKCAIAEQTMSLANKAERTPAPMTVPASSACGETSRLASHRVKRE